MDYQGDPYGYQSPTTPQYTPVPGSPGMYYDPATGQVYGNPGGSAGYVPGADYMVPGNTYNPGTGQLTNNGTLYNPNPNATGLPNPSDLSTLAWNAVPPAATQTGGTTGGGGGSSTGSGLPNPFGITPFQAPSWVGLPSTPTFTPPSYTPPPAFSYAPFQAPTLDQALAEPGGQFAINQGLGAVTNNAAARGLWATGATGKALNDYARNAADQLYGNIYSRDLNTYLANANQAMNAYAMNAQTQYLQPYSIAFQNAQAAFAPQALGYQTQANAVGQQNSLNYNTALNAWNDLFSQRLQSGNFLQGAAAS